jgi:hypothetical protein
MVHVITEEIAADIIGAQVLDIDRPAKDLVLSQLGDEDVFGKVRLPRVRRPDEEKDGVDGTVYIKCFRHISSYIFNKAAY